MRRRYRAADLRAMIPLYLDGELAEAEQVAVEAYLAEHPEELGEVTRAAQLIEVLDDAIRSAPPDDAFCDEVMQRLRALTRWQRWWLRWPLVPTTALLRWAAELALLALVTFLFVTHPWAPSLSPIECQLLGDSNWTVGLPTAVRVIVRERGSGALVPNALVRARLHPGRWGSTLFQARTNDQGTVDAEFRLASATPPGDYTLLVRVDSSVGAAAAAHAVRIRQRRTVQLETLSDAVALGDDLVATALVTDLGTAARLDDVLVDWTLEDRWGRVLSWGRQTTSAAGAALLRIPTSADTEPGTGLLRVRVGDAVAVRPVELRPPLPRDLRVDSAPPRHAVSGESIDGLVTVRRSDEPVAGAAVKAVLTVGDRTVTTVGYTDARGRWPYRLAVPAVRTTSIGWLRLVADDGNGRRGAGDWPVAVAREPVLLSIQPAAGSPVVGLASRVVVTATRPDGSPLPSRLSVRSKLDGEAATVATDADGHAVLRYRPTARVNHLSISTAVDGRTVRSSLTLAAQPSSQGLAVEPESTVVRAGEGLRVSLRAAAPLTVAYVDLVGLGQTLATRSLTPAGAEGSLVFPIPDQVSGEAALRAYARGTDGSWRYGWAALRIEPASQLLVDLTSDPQQAGQLRIRAQLEGDQPPPAAVAVAFVRQWPDTPETATAPRPAPPRGWTLAANSVRLERAQALLTQQRFFRRSPVFGGVIAGLVLFCVALFVIQIQTDPFEVITARERACWGRTPAVHRRGPWAGLGMMVTGLLSAVVVTGGVLLAGHQARELAAVNERPEAGWQPSTAPVVEAARLVASAPSAAAARSRCRAPIQVGAIVDVSLEAGEAGCAIPAGGPWRAVAWGAGPEQPQPVVSGPLALNDGPHVEWSPPTELRVGDTIAVPVALVNPTPDPCAIVVNYFTSGGLELTSAPTARTVLPALGTLPLTVPLRAAEPGLATVAIEVHGAEVPRAERQVRIVPVAERLVLAEEGAIDGRVVIQPGVPEEGQAALLEVEIDDRPAAAWDEVLAAVMARPALDGYDALVAAEAARLRLVLTAGERSDRQMAALAGLQRAWQALLRYEVVAAGRPTGAFAAQPGGSPDAVLSAGVAVFLSSIEALAAGEPSALGRVRGWLARHGDSLAERLAIEPAGGRIPGLLGPALLAWAEGDSTAAERLTTLATAAAAARDPYALAHLARAAQRLSDPRLRERILELLVALRERRDTGGPWYSGARPTLTGETGIAAAVETTALSVTALSTSESESCRSAAQEGASYLVSRRLPDGSWGAPEATVRAIEALAAISAPGRTARGSVVVELDGRELARGELDGEHRRVTVLRSVATRPPPRVVVRFAGKGQPYYRLRLAYSRSRRPAEPGILSATMRLAGTVTAPDGKIDGVLRVRHSGETTLRSVEAALALPPGFTVRGDGWTVNQGTAYRVAGPIRPASATDFPFILQATAEAATVTPPPAQVYARRNPELRAVAELPRLTIAGEPTVSLRYGSALIARRLPL